MIMERGEPSPQMEQLIKQLARRHALAWAEKGRRLTVAMSTRTDRWLIANLDGVRLSLTHCWVEPGECLAADLDMVFVLYPDGWEPVELRHTEAVWQHYVQAAQAAGIAIYDGQGETSFAHFTEYWARQMAAQGWLTHSYPVAETAAEGCGEAGGRMAGCQSTHTGPCYGELWQCAACGKTVCCAEGSDNHPELCDDCWCQQYGNQEVDDVPF